jgi:hypothetical protein
VSLPAAPLDVLLGLFRFVRKLNDGVELVDDALKPPNAANGFLVAPLWEKNKKFQASVSSKKDCADLQDHTRWIKLNIKT